MNRILKFVLIGTIALLLGLALASPPVALADSGPIISRQYPWSADHLTLEIPADVHFRPGPSWHLSIRAPRHTLDQLVVENGVIRAKPRECFSLIPFCIGFGAHIGHKVDVRITGPALRAITIEGTGSLDLQRVRQHRLRLTIEGSATVRGAGSVDSASLEIDGAGNIHLAHLSEARARVLIRGSGTVDIAPTDSVSVHIDGSGTVRLHSDPPHVTSRIFGAGEIVKVPGSARAAPARGAGPGQPVSPPAGPSTP